MKRQILIMLLHHWWKYWVELAVKNNKKNDYIKQETLGLYWLISDLQLTHWKLERTCRAHISTRGSFLTFWIFVWKIRYGSFPKCHHFFLWPYPHKKSFWRSDHYFWSNVNKNAKVIKNTLKMWPLKVWEFLVSRFWTGSLQKLNHSCLVNPYLHKFSERFVYYLWSYCKHKYVM